METESHAVGYRLGSGRVRVNSSPLNFCGIGGVRGWRGSSEGPPFALLGMTEKKSGVINAPVSLIGRRQWCAGGSRGPSTPQTPVGMTQKQDTKKRSLVGMIGSADCGRDDTEKDWGARAI